MHQLMKCKEFFDVYDVEKIKVMSSAEKSVVWRKNVDSREKSFFWIHSNIHG